MRTPCRVRLLGAPTEPMARIENCPDPCETEHRMPLSEDEQRILRQIQEQLETDERFATAVSSSGLYRTAARSLRWAALGVVASLAFTIYALQIHFLVAFIGFLGMLACVLVIERQLRAMSKVGLKDVSATIRGARMNAQSIRDRFTRDV